MVTIYHLLCPELTVRWPVNIFSHVIGSLLFFAIPVYVFNVEVPPRYTVATVPDKIVCSIYFIGVAICFVFSAT